MRWVWFTCHTIPEIQRQRLVQHYRHQEYKDIGYQTYLINQIKQRAIEGERERERERDKKESHRNVTY